MKRRDFIIKGTQGTAAILYSSHIVAGDIMEKKTEPMGTLKKKLEQVNTTDMADAIRLGCRTMQNVFNADDNQFPFFASIAWPEAFLRFNNNHGESHVPGRYLNALLSAEDTIGFEPDEEAIENHRRAAFFSYSGPFALPMNRQKTDGPLVNFCPHNLREGFHALYALVKYRNDKKARELAEQNIAAVFDLWHPENGWDVQRFSFLGLNFQECQGFIHGEGRMLGPLVKYYRATGYAPALELALVMKEKAVADFFTSDGDFDAERFITRHCHSVTCVMSSLAQLADLLGDAALLERVKAFYDNGLWKIRDEIGWSLEIINQEDSDHGEANNTGDILETALILGRCGYPEYYQDAERILRCHLLPSQLRDISFISDPPNPDNRDGLRDVANRHLGAFGFPAPYGHKSVGKGRRGQISFNMDIVGGVTASLCEAVKEITRTGTTGTRVNLYFDFEDNIVKIQSPYTHDCLQIEMKQTGPLFVRVPCWINPDEIKTEGTANPPVWTNNYLFFNTVRAGQILRIRFPLKESQVTLSEELHIHPIRVKLRGDMVVEMDSFGADLTYFEPFE